MFSFTLLGSKKNMKSDGLVKWLTNDTDSWGEGKFVTIEAAKEFVSNDDKLYIQGSVRIIPVSFGSPFDDLPDQTTASDILSTAFFHPELLLNNPSMSDLTFKVGQEGKSFPVHSMIMSTVSPVFFTMIFPSNESNFDRKNEKELSDVSPSVFMSILRFIYRREVVIEKNLIEPVLDAIEKYDIKSFPQALESLVTKETVLDFFPFVVGERHRLFDHVCKVFQDNFESILSSNEFLELSAQVLKHILERDTLDIQEIDLYNAYVKWADHQCQEKELELTDANRREVMVDIKLIRFPCMSQRDFALGPGKSNILTPEEKLDIILYMAAKDDVKTSFITTPRTA